ncbi:hypothetical protein [Aquiflexum gelatinilyticum]|uniref:IPT/TIG domain-containing protein n=1 Tax=Aquiflexum gelatinilyticum TaxID=2961943 RepID=A0A9X2T157_9BACT|nr:hypothetical protein [Aquiflexum gelatinilyticum]MCR9015546.1 hypothetical protein [Aquiflexum gelatinilyticum]
MRKIIFPYFKKILLRLLLFVLMLGSLACSEEEGPNNVNNPNPQPTTKLEITETSPEFVFWGEEITIKGTGFSTKTEDNFVWLKGESQSFGNCALTNRTDSLGWRKATVISATTTSLTVRIPYVPASQNANNKPCGVYNPNLSITVAGKTVVSPQVKLLGKPFINEVCISNSGFKGSGIIPGKQSNNVISIGGLGMFGSASGMDAKMKLAIGSENIPLIKTDPPIATCSNGYSFTIPITMASGECTPDPIRTGRFSKMMDFVASIEGTSIQSEKFSYPVGSFPDQSIESLATQRASKSAAGNPEIKIKGKGLNWYKEARFISTNSAGCPMATIAPVSNVAGTELTVLIPLAQMNANCTYQLSLINTCNLSTGQIGQVIIDP